MSEKSYKRKRSIQDTPVDLTKMQLVRQRLAALQEELAGIEETEEEMEEVTRHVEALQYILGTAKKLVSIVFQCCCMVSDVTAETSIFVSPISRP